MAAEPGPTTGRGSLAPWPGTVEALTATLNGHDAAAPVFDAVPTTPTRRIDLTAAKVPYKTPDGVADLHSLRLTYATMLARAGVSLAQAQTLTRHSDPMLKANIYTRLQLDDGHAAVTRIDFACA